MHLKQKSYKIIFIIKQFIGLQYMENRYKTKRRLFWKSNSNQLAKLLLQHLPSPLSGIWPRLSCVHAWGSQSRSVQVWKIYKKLNNEMQHHNKHLALVHRAVLSIYLLKKYSSWRVGFRRWSQRGWCLVVPPTRRTVCLSRLQHSFAVLETSPVGGHATAAQTL